VKFTPSRLNTASGVKLCFHYGVLMRPTARQSCLFNVALCAAAVYCEVMRIEPDPIVRRAKITRGNALPDDKRLVTFPFHAQSQVRTTVQSQLESRILLRLKFLGDIWLKGVVS